MAARKSILKFFIIIILAVFLLSTALISVLYLGGSKNDSVGTGDVTSGDVVSGTATGDITSSDISTGTALVVSGTDLSESVK